MRWHWRWIISESRMCYCTWCTKCKLQTTLASKQFIQDVLKSPVKRSSRNALHVLHVY